MIELSTVEMTVEGNEYVITTGTGEGTFAYDAADYAASAEAATTYQDFCNELSPITDEEEVRSIAIAAAAREGLRLTRDGSCDAVLSDDEYALVRAAVAAVQS